MRRVVSVNRGKRAFDVTKFLLLVLGFFVGAGGRVFRA
jgi:hypothetical protein